MATLTPYQCQFRQRMKRAISLRAKADRKARSYASQLVRALLDAQTAAAMMNALNQLYNVDVSTQTLLVHDLLALVTPQCVGRQHAGRRVGTVQSGARRQRRPAAASQSAVRRNPDQSSAQQRAAWWCW